MISIDYNARVKEKTKRSNKMIVPSRCGDADRPTNIFDVVIAKALPGM